MFRSIISGVALTLFATSAFANGMKAEQKVTKEEVYVAADGSENVRLVEADTVVPGETVVYSVNYVNEGAEPAEGLKLVQAVPGDVLYKEGSALVSGAMVAFSTDGGETYMPRAELTVVKNGERVPADTSDITHIRWTLTTDVNPGESGSVSFKGELL